MTYSNELVGYKEFILCIFGPSGSGKSTLAKYILQNNNSGRGVEIIKSYTTRSKRKDESNEDHIFINEDEFLKKVKKKEIQLYGKPHNQNYFVGYNLIDITSCIKIGNIPIIVTRVPDILRNMSKIFSFVHYCDVTNFTQLIPWLTKRDGTLTNKDTLRLGEEMGILTSLNLKPQIENTIGIKLLFNFNDEK